jgi:hypothetical protein
MFGEKFQGQMFDREVYAGLWGKPDGKGPLRRHRL